MWIPHIFSQFKHNLHSATGILLLCVHWTGVWYKYIIRVDIYTKGFLCWYPDISIGVTTISWAVDSTIPSAIWSHELACMWCLRLLYTCTHPALIKSRPVYSKWSRFSFQIKCQPSCLWFHTCFSDWCCLAVCSCMWSSDSLIQNHKQCPDVCS